MDKCEKCEIYREMLRHVAGILNEIKYDYSSREYTLDEDEMGWVFYCRDACQKTLMDFK